MQKRRGQSDLVRSFSGADREQFEGPLGESLLPGPSIGYSRIVVRNIHQGKSGTGYAEHEFYTSKDYPFDLTYASADIEKERLNQVKSKGVGSTAIEGASGISASIGVGLASLDVDIGAKHQGFRFVLNNMHGRPKSTATYAGEYNSPNAFTVEKTTYEYFQPGEKIPVMTGPDYEDDIVLQDIGKEMEVVVESRRIDDIGNNINGQADYGAFLAAVFAFPYGSAHASYGHSQGIFNTHVTTKIVNYPVFQKAVTVFKDGVTTRTEYAGFDPLSGKPVLMKQSDGFDGMATGGSSTPRNGTYYTVSLPASRYYPVMGQVAANQGLKIGGVYADGYVIDKRYYEESGEGHHYLVVNFTASGKTEDVIGRLRPGDLIEVIDGGEHLGVYHISDIAANRVNLLSTSYSRINNYPLRRNVTIQVIRSGNTNRVAADVGGFTTYGTPPDVTKKALPNP